MPDQRDPMFGVVNTFEAEIGITPGFLERLLNEGDDWSFVIKVHALAEAALTHLLTAAVGREELRDLFGSLTMGDSKRGKLAVAARLHLLDPRRVAFFRALGRIGNQFVHDVKHAGLRIEEYAQSLTSVDQDQLWQDLIRGYTIEPDIIDFDGRPIPSGDFARARPRFTIWVASMSALALIYHAKTFDEGARQRLFAALSTMKPSAATPSRRPET